MADNRTTWVITARDETRAAFNAVKGSLKSLNDAAARLPLIGTALTTAFSGAALTAGVKNVIDGADQLNKASQKYGVSVEKLSALSYAGKLADVSMEAIGNGLKKLSVNMLDAAAGTGDAKDAFKALGIEVKNADGSLKSSDQVLGEIADRFAGMEDGAAKTALAVKLFGKAGAELIPFLNAGSKGLKEMKEEAERLGVVISTDLARSSEQFNDNMTRLSFAVKAAAIGIGNDLLPGLVKMTSTMVEATKASGGLFAGIMNIINLPVTGSVYDNLDALEKQLAETDKKITEVESKPFFLRGLNLGGLKKNREEILEQLKFVKEIIKLRGGGKETSDFGPPVWTGKTKAPELPKTDKKQVDDQITQMRKLGEQYEQMYSSAEKYVAGLEAQEAAGRQLTDSEKQLLEVERLLPTEWANAIKPLLERAAALEKNNKLAAEGIALTEKMRSPAEALAAEQIRLNALLAAGAVNWETYARATFAAQDAYDELIKKSEQANNQMTEFAKQAAANMQDAFSSFFFNIMQGKFDDMASNFKATIDRMVADLLASQLLKYLLGDFGTTGKLGGALGGWIGELFGSARGNVFGPGGVHAFAAGGIVSTPTVFPFARGVGLMGEAGPEAIMPLKRGADGKLGVAASGGAVAVYNSFTINGATDRRSQQQIAAEVGAAVERAMRRNG